MATSSSEAHFECHNRGFQVGQNEGTISTTFNINSSVKTDRIDFRGRYSKSSIRPVANHVRRPKLHQKIKAQLHDTKDEAEDTRILVVWGLGGAGKSQLVLDYIREYRQDYFATFWIEAGQKESIERDYLEIDRLLFGRAVVAGQSPSNVGDAITAVKSWFDRQSGRSLMVFDSADTIDNADDKLYIDLLYFLPDALSLDIIITTRSSQAKEMTPLDDVRVADMEPPEAAELFRRCAKLNNAQEGIENEVESIVEELGSLALAITLAGSYVSQTPRLSSDIRQYLPEYRQRRKELLGHKAKNYVHQYRESVLSTWKTSFSAVAQQSPVASRLLSFLAFLNFDIFLDLFDQGTGDTMQETEIPIRQSRKLSRIPVPISAVRSRKSQPRSLNQRDQGTGDITQGTDVPTRQSRKLSRVSVPISAVRSHRSQLRPLDQRVGPSVSPQQWRSFISPDAPLDRYALEEAFVELQKFSLVQWRRDQSGYAMHKLVHAWAYERLELEHQRDVSFAALQLLVDVASSWARDPVHKSRLVPHLMANFAICSTVYNALNLNHTELLEYINRASRFLHDPGRSSYAYEIQNFHFTKMNEMFGEEHLDTLWSMSNLAVYLHNQGRYQESEQLDRRTLELRINVLGPEHPDTLLSIHNLAITLAICGKDTEAEQMHRQALQSRTKILGAEHPATLESMEGLAVALKNQGKCEHQEAERLLRSTLISQEKILGSEHPDTLRSMETLAEVLGRQNRYQEAERIYRSTQMSLEKILGLQHPATLGAMHNLAYKSPHHVSNEPTT